MKNTVKAVLDQAGQDSGKYLSLHIAKGDLPEGSEIVVQVRDKKTGVLRPVRLGGSEETRAFAENSRFYGQTMADGHIFNPYVHRRFIAAHFRRLINLHGIMGIRQGVARSFTWDYSIGLVRKEAHKLNNLWKHDREGYFERSRFFTIEKIAQILADYAAAVDKYLDELGCRSNANQVYVPDYGMVKRQNLRPMKHRFVILAAQAKGCKTYKELDTLLSEFDWLKLPNNLGLPMSFVDPFVESGAYYTLKHHMMFEGLKMWGKPQSESLTELRAYKSNYLGLYQQIM